LMCVQRFHCSCSCVVASCVAAWVSDFSGDMSTAMFSFLIVLANIAGIFAALHSDWRTGPFAVQVGGSGGVRVAVVASDLSRAVVRVDRCGPRRCRCVGQCWRCSARQAATWTVQAASF
jgi:hypothetical protein